MKWIDADGKRVVWTAVSGDPMYLAGLERILEGLRKAGLPEGENSADAAASKSN